MPRVRALIRDIEWPATHIGAFGQACKSGKARDWREPTRRGVEQRWGLWLDSCRRHGFRIDGRPSSTVSHASLRAWINELRTRVTICTAASYVRDAREALRVMEPDASDALMLMCWAAADLHRAARPKPDELTGKVGASTIYEMAVAKMDALWAHCLHDIEDASVFRDSLMVAYDILTGVRRRTLTLTHQRHFKPDHDVFEIYYAPHETKTREPYEATMPAEFSPYIERGFAVARFICENSGNPWDGRLWMSREGRAMTDREVYVVVCAATERLVGVRLNPQRLRRAIPTSIQRFIPAKSSLGASVLQHHSERMTQRYIKADTSTSIMEYHRLLAEIPSTRQKK